MMLLRFILAAALALAPVRAMAQLPLLGAGPGTLSTAGGGTYTGIGDIKAADHYWGMRAYNAAKATAGANAVQVCTAADALCTNIRVTSSGGLNAADITTSTCTAALNCTVKTIYDQAGSCDVTVIGGASRPQFNPTGVLSSKPDWQAFAFSAALGGTCSSINAPYSWLISVLPNGTPGGNERIGGGSTNDSEVFFNASNQFGLRLSGLFYNTSVTASNGTYYAVLAGSGASNDGFVSVNGTTVTGNAGNAATGTDIQVQGSSTAGSTLDGAQSEFAVFSSKLSGGEITSLTANMRSYWGY